MKTQIRWTEEEDKILLNFIKDNPGNLQEAYRRTSAATGRTVAVTQYHWQYVLRKKVEVFQLSSGSKSVVNTKNTPKKIENISDMSASDLCKLLILKLETKKYCLENMIDGLKAFLTHNEEL